MILGSPNVEISMFSISICGMHAFFSQRRIFIIPVICLEEIKKPEDRRGSNKLTKIDIINVLESPPYNYCNRGGGSLAVLEFCVQLS